MCGSIDLFYHFPSVLGYILITHGSSTSCSAGPFIFTNETIFK
jgi:hypothetical protein